MAPGRPLPRSAPSSCARLPRPVGVRGSAAEIAQIEELVEQSNGGFGAFLTLAHNWANPQATKKSYELFARHVMPRFQGQVDSLIGAADRARASRPELADKQMIAVEEATQRYEEEKEAIVLS